MKRLALDGMTAHWEFAYGPVERFEELVHQLDYPMLAINYYRRKTGKLGISPIYYKREIWITSGPNWDLCYHRGQGHALTFQ